jgi:hypothetical protein
MTSAKRLSLVIAAAGLVGATAIAPAAEAQSRRGIGRRVVYVRPTSFGWYGYPYAYDPFYAGYWGYGPYFGPHAGFGFYEPRVDMNAAAIRGLGAVELNAKPGQAEVWVDGKFVAEARDLDGSPSFLWLKEGPHHIVVYKGGYANFDEQIDVRRGVHKDLKVRLQKGDSVAPGQRDASSK